MFSIQHKPSAPLDDYIENMVYYKELTENGNYTRAMPDGVVQLVIHLDEHNRILTSQNSDLVLRKAFITGIQRQQTTYKSVINASAISIRFKAGGLYAFTNIPQTEMANLFLEADLIFGSSVLLLREEILNCKDPKTIFLKIENFFVCKLIRSNSTNATINYITQNLNSSIPQLVEKIGYSQKHIIHLFKKHVGFSPKYFQRIHRFNKVLWDIHSASTIDWQDIVHKNEYFDQSHFIKEFNHFSGMNPQSYHSANCAFPIFVPLSKVR
jgi:AraC-like DNA-binding protein